MMMAFAFSISANAKKPKPIFKNKIEVDTAKLSKRSNLINFEVEVNEYDEKFINFRLENLTDERIYIEWENTRIDGGKVVFSDDRIIMKNIPKADEAVSSQSSSLLRDIAYNTSGNYLISLFKVKDLKKKIGEENHIYLTIPIRYMDNTIDEFNIKITVWYELASTTK